MEVGRVELRTSHKRKKLNVYSTNKPLDRAILMRGNCYIHYDLRSVRRVEGLPHLLSGQPFTNRKEN